GFLGLLLARARRLRFLARTVLLLTAGQRPLRRIAGGPTGGGLEAHPTGAFEVELRPGVGVLHAHVIAAVVLFAAGEADTDAGGDPHGPGHDRHRRGELDDGG